MRGRMRGRSMPWRSLVVAGLRDYETFEADGAKVADAGLAAGGIAGVEAREVGRVELAPARDQDLGAEV